LRALLDLPEVGLYDGLAHLQAAEFLDFAGSTLEPSYTFKHALTNDVAYGSLLQEQRRVLHARVVGAIERLYADRLGDWTEWLAQHALRGELWDKAIAYLRQAGGKMAARSAHREAVTWLEEALEALQHRPDNPETRALAIDMRFDLRHALYPLGEYDRILQLLGEAERLAETIADARRLGWVSAYLTSSFLQRLDYGRALAAGQRALALAAQRDDAGLRVMAHFFLGQVYYHCGEYHQAADVLRRNVAALQGPLLYERFDLPYLPAVQSSAWLARALAELGRFDEGREVAEKALRTAEAPDPFSLVHTHYSVGFVYLRRGHLSDAIAVLERGLALAQRLQLSTWFPIMTAALGYAQALAGHTSLATPLLEEAMKRLASQRTIFFQPVTLAWLGEAWLLVGCPDEALSLAQQALEVSRDRQERGNQAWSLCLLAAIDAGRHPGEVDRARDAYRQALTLAEELGIRPLMAHCHHGLGAIDAQFGQRQQATHGLTTALAFYRAMQMTH
jgi:tetratricopeptide (TPR) repeat protein